MASDPVLLVRRLVSLRHSVSCNPNSRRLKQQYFGMNLALSLLGYEFLPEEHDSWDSVTRSTYRTHI